MTALLTWAVRHLPSQTHTVRHTPVTHRQKAWRPAGLETAAHVLTSAPAADRGLSPAGLRPDHVPGLFLSFRVFAGLDQV